MLHVLVRTGYVCDSLLCLLFLSYYYIVITLYGLHSMFYKPSVSHVQVGLRNIE